MNDNTAEPNEIPQELEQNAALDELKESLQNVCTATDRCVRRYPWASIGIAALAGMIVGLIIGDDD